MGALEVASKLVSLAKASLESCKNVRLYRQEATRIGERLTWFLARTHEWEKFCRNTSKSNNTGMNPGEGTFEITTKEDTMNRFVSALEWVHVCLQAAAETDQGKWKRRIRLALKGKDLYQELLRAEESLGKVISDFSLEHAIQSFDFGRERYDSIEEKLNHVLQLISDNDPKKTLGQEIEHVLASYNERDHHIDHPHSHQEHIAKKPNDRAGSITFDMAESTSSSGSGDEEQGAKQDISDAMLACLEINPDDLRFDNNSNRIGRGGFADVFRDEYKGEAVAVKRLRLDNPNKHDGTNLDTIGLQVLQTEALLLAQCASHPHIVEIIGCHMATSLTRQPFLVLELMHTTLFHAIHGAVTLDVTLSHVCLYKLLHGISKALEYLHLQGIVHQDVKSLNILIDKDASIAKLADFGEAKVKKSLQTTRLNRHANSVKSANAVGQSDPVGGTVAYQAPEMFAPKTNTVSRMAEMYSFGVVVWECLSRAVPHQGKSTIEVTVLATNQSVPMLEIPLAMPPFQAVHDTAQTSTTQEQAAWERMLKVAKTCLSRTREDRPTASQVVAAWNQTTMEGFGRVKFGRILSLVNGISENESGAKTFIRRAIDLFHHVLRMPLILFLGCFKPCNRFCMVGGFSFATILLLILFFVAPSKSVVFVS